MPPGSRPRSRSVDEAAAPRVTAHTSAPGRTVLVERGNGDAWIASDLAVDLGR